MPNTKQQWRSQTGAGDCLKFPQKKYQGKIEGAKKFLADLTRWVKNVVELFASSAD